MASLRMHEGGRVTFDELINYRVAAQSLRVEEIGGNPRRTERHSSAFPDRSIPRDGLARTHDQCDQIRRA